MKIIRVPVGTDREALLPLLLLADDSESQVRSYMQSGYLFSAVNAEHDLLGSVLVIPMDESSAEIKSVAVDPNRHNQGLGTQMLGLVVEELRRLGFRRLILGTGNSSIGQIAFYQKLGFRIFGIEQDFFVASNGYPDPIYENDILLRDMIWLEMDTTAEQ